MFDTHVHLDRLNPEQRQAWDGTGWRTLGIGTDPESWARQQLEATPQAYGLHPWWVDHNWAARLEKLETYLPRAAALGEFGLDRGRRADPERYPQQEHAFIAQLELARRHQLPVVLHFVRSHGWAQKLLGDEPLSGVVHGFTGSVETARSYLKLGLSLGVGGRLLDSPKLEGVIREVPLERLLLESDAPFQMDRPETLLKVLGHLARLRGTSKGKLAKLLETNAERIFDLRGQPLTKF